MSKRYAIFLTALFCGFLAVFFAANLISPNNQVSKHCRGFAVSGYLVEAGKVEDAEMEQWKRDYPDAFARDYDPAIGINYDSWVVEG